MKYPCAALLPLALAACAASEPPADPGALIAPLTTPISSTLHAPPLFAGFAPRPVVEPGEWRRMNDRQSPTAGGE